MKLSDVCTKGTSNIAQKDLDARNGTYPIYGASGFIKNVDFYHQEKPYIAIVKDGAGVGRVMQLPAKSSVIGTMQYIIPNEGVSVEYLAYALEHMNLSKYYLGAAIPHIYFKDYCSETLPNHTPEEQAHISHVLGLVSNLIFLRKQQLSKLDELVKSRFIEMFGTETEFDRWDCCTIGDVSDVCVGVVIKPTQYYSQTGIPAFRSLNIGEMRVKDDDWVYFTEEGHQKNQKSIIRENDVLVVRSGAPGTACVATKKYDGYNAIDIIIAHPDNSKVNSVFLAAFTNMPHGMNQIREGTGGAAQQHFNVGGYKSRSLILPPLELQNEFEAFVKQIDKSKFEIQQSLEKLETLKKALMQKYFG